jgi:small basic protein
MNGSGEFGRLQRKVYLAYHQDGIIDLVIGLCALGFGTSMVTDSAGFILLSWLPITLYVPLKKAITLPRFGYVKFTSVKTTRMVYAGVMVSGVLMLLLFGIMILIISAGDIPASTQIWLRQYHMAVLGGIAAILVAGVAFLVGIRRFYAYALLAVVLPTLGAVLNVATYLPVLVLGLTIFAVGCWLLAGFIRRYPKSRAREAHVDGKTTER